MDASPRYTNYFAVSRTCQKCHHKASTNGGGTLTARSGARVWYCRACMHKRANMQNSVCRKTKEIQT